VDKTQTLSARITNKCLKVSLPLPEEEVRNKAKGHGRIRS
jgi:hypothetical protein